MHKKGKINSGKRLKLSIFAVFMKELRYILAVLFSSLIIISGVGVSVVQYCCAGCETTQSCCASGCSKCHDTHRASQKTCKDTGCTAVYYKVDFVKNAHESVSFVPPLTLFCEQLPFFDYSVPQVAHIPKFILGAPPYSVGSRHYLTLYSILLI